MSEFEMAKIDLEAVKRKTANLPSNIPTELQRIPTEEQKRDIIKYLAFNGLVLILDFGGDLISLVSPKAGKAWNAFIKWRFDWKPKSVDLSFLKDK